MRQPIEQAALGRVMLWLRRAQGTTIAARHAAFLVTVEGLANVFDYSFHIYLGRSLPVQGFATVQTINAVLLIVLTAAGIWQPVVARFVAANTGEMNDAVRAIVQYYLALALGAGAVVTLLACLVREALAEGLNVPTSAIVLAASILLVAFARPVVAGVLQGQQRFISLGLARMTFAVGRVVLALLLVGLLGGGTLAAVATFPLAALLSLLVGLGLLGRAAWKSAPAVPLFMRRLGWRLSAGALLAYLSYMALINLDLVWVNRLFSARISADYATAVLLRKAMALLPGVVVVLVYPRVARLAARGESIDGLLIKAVLAIGLPSLVISALYFLMPRPIIALTFGARYGTAAPLLGWLGLGMIGYALAALWMNVFLASRPGPYTGLLVATAAAQIILLSRYNSTVIQIIVVFAATGWFLVIMGLLLYATWLRSAILAQGERSKDVTL